MPQSSVGFQDIQVAYLNVSKNNSRFFCNLLKTLLVEITVFTPAMFEAHKGHVAPVA